MWFLCVIFAIATATLCAVNDESDPDVTMIAGFCLLASILFLGFS
jgi:hypothetical protein